MSKVLPHTKILNAAARDVLRPIGMVQKGRSRTWLDDHGWWLGRVVFDSSSWSRGTYTNIAVCWLWNPKDHLSTDYGSRYRLGGYGEFVRYQSDEQFTPLAHELAVAGARRIVEYRDLFATIHSTANTLELHSADAVGWGCMHAGIALGLAGEPKRAKRMFARFDQIPNQTRETKRMYDQLRRLRDHPDPAKRIEVHFGSDDAPRPQWAIDASKRRDALVEAVDDRARFAQMIRDDVAATRALMKLPPAADLPF